MFERYLLLIPLFQRDNPGVGQYDDNIKQILGFMSTSRNHGLNFIRPFRLSGKKLQEFYFHLKAQNSRCSFRVRKRRPASQNKTKTYVERGGHLEQVLFESRIFSIFSSKQVYDTISSS